jgi:hypothetical protein
MSTGLNALTTVIGSVVSTCVVVLPIYDSSFPTALALSVTGVAAYLWVKESLGATASESVTHLPPVRTLPSTRAGQQEPRRSIDDARRTIPARLRWKVTQSGLAIDVTNPQSGPMIDAQLIVGDMQWWDPALNQFVKTRDMHADNHFEPIALHSDVRVYRCGTSVTVDFVATDRDDAICVSGYQPTDPTRAMRTKRDSHTGRWRADLELVWANGRCQQRLEFDWDGTVPPVPV